MLSVYKTYYRLLTDDVNQFLKVFLAESGGIEPRPPQDGLLISNQALVPPSITIQILADKVGFEPTDPFKGRRFSRPVQ